MNKVKFKDDITAYAAELIGMIKDNCELKTECIKKMKSIELMRGIMDIYLIKDFQCERRGR